MSGMVDGAHVSLNTETQTATHTYSQLTQCYVLNCGIKLAHRENMLAQEEHGNWYQVNPHNA